METALDIFRTDNFRATTTTEMVGNIDSVPTELDEMNIFEPVYLTTTTITLAAKNGTLSLVQTSQRGAPEQLPDRRNWTIRQVEAPRLAQRDRINSHEVQNLLNPILPMNQRLANANDLITDRQAIMVEDDANTREYHRLGALKGLVLDADGTSVVDSSYDNFGIVAPAAINFNFGTIPTNDLVAEFDTNITIPIKRTLKGRWRTGTKIHALVGDTFWRKLTTHEGVQRMWVDQAGLHAKLGESKAWETLDFAGIIWHHYAGSDNGQLDIADNEARFFPIGAKDVFKAYFVPGEDFGDVNQRAKDIYSIVSPDNRTNMNEWVDLYVRSYILFTCLCPSALLRATHS